METIKYLGIDCVSLTNKTLRLLVTKSVGPRIISLSATGGENIFAGLPDMVTRLPDGRVFHFHGGHRLWHAPENMPRTYIPDEDPVEIRAIENGIIITQPVEADTGIQKSLKINLSGENAPIIIDHKLTNHGSQPIECSPWAITQLKTGGVAILPLSQEQTGFLPNRSLVFWPYSDITNTQISWGNRYLFVRAQMQSPFKVGFRNPRGWLAYWIDRTLFVKRAKFDSKAEYYDFGSSSECYCNDRFLELETLAPISKINPGQSTTHTEIWELHPNIDFPVNEAETEIMVNNLGLE
jgi:hypothetical protein